MLWLYVPRINTVSWLAGWLKASSRLALCAHASGLLVAFRPLLLLRVRFHAGNDEEEREISWNLSVKHSGIFRSLWKNKCQPKHKVFFWLWLKNKLNTRDMPRRKNMTLESYTCENCIWQKEETLYHLFLKCNFVKACWNSFDAPKIY
jgi:hypothetical protein